MPFVWSADKVAVTLRLLNIVFTTFLQHVVAPTTSMAVDALGGLVCAPLHIIAAGEIFHVMVGILLACTLKVRDKHISPVLEEV